MKCPKCKAFNKKGVKECKRCGFWLVAGYGVTWGFMVKSLLIIYLFLFLFWFSLEVYL